MKHRSHRCPPKHVAAVIAFLQDVGATVGEVVINRCHRVFFSLSGMRFALRVGLTCEVTRALRLARIELHRMLIRAGLSAPIAA